MANVFLHSCVIVLQSFAAITYVGRKEIGIHLQI